MHLEKKDEGNQEIKGEAIQRMERKRREDEIRRKRKERIATDPSCG